MKNKNSHIINRLTKKNKKTLMIAAIGIAALSCVGLLFSFQSKEEQLVKDPNTPSLTTSPTIILAPTVNTPTQSAIKNTYASPTLIPTLTPTSAPTSVRMHMVYQNKDDNNKLTTGGGKIEVKANDGSYNFTKDNTTEETIGDLTPKRYTIIMYEPAGYTYETFHVEDGTGHSFGSPYCSVQWDVEVGKNLDIRCWVKKN